MNANRKADLQRKLALAPVPKPPAGLAERIKTEIPKELRFNAERERERMSRSVRFSMSVAASVLIVISAAYVALNMMSGGAPTISAARARKSAAATEKPAVMQAPPAAPVAEEDRGLKKKKPVSKLAARRVKEEKKQPVALAEPQVNAMSKVAAATEAPAPEAPAAARTMAMDRAEAALPMEMTTSPISGKAMVRAGANVYDAPAKTNLSLVAWKDASRETKIEILKKELARGADPQAVARAAREAGLNDFADSIEKQR